MTSSPANPLALVLVDNHLELESSGSMLQPFLEFLSAAEGWKTKVAAIKVTDVSQVREMALARQTRLALKDIRTASDRTRKTLKEESLNRGRAIDGMHAVVVSLIAPLEDSLREQEEFAVRKENARKLALKTSRQSLLQPYGADTSFYDLGAMPDETFKDLLDGQRIAHQQREETRHKAEQAKIEADKQERIRQEALAQENARLKAEKIEADRIQKEKDEASRQERLKEQAKAETERVRLQSIQEAKDKTARAEKQALEDRLAKESASAQAKLKSEREIAAAKESEERKAKEAAQAELNRIKAEADRKAKADAEIARKAAMAPDRDKLIAMAAQVRSIQVPEMLSAEGVSLQVEILMRIDELAQWIDSKAKAF